MSRRQETSGRHKVQQLITNPLTWLNTPISKGFRRQTLPTAMTSSYWDTLPGATDAARSCKWVCTVTADSDAAFWQQRLQKHFALGRLRAYEFAFEVGHGLVTPFPHSHVYVWTAGKRHPSYIRSLLRQDAYIAICPSDFGYRTFIRKQQNGFYRSEHQRLLPRNAHRFYSAGGLLPLDEAQAPVTARSTDQTFEELILLGDLSQLDGFDVPKTWETTTIADALSWNQLDGET